MLGFVSHTIARPGAGAYVGGVFVAGADEVLVIKGSVQPIGPSALQRLPEGQRLRARAVLYTRAELRCASVAGAHQADRLDWQGHALVVDGLEDFSSALPSSRLNHRAYVLLAVEVSP